MWAAPRIWTGSEPAFIIGGGPSVSRESVLSLEGRGHVVAVNNAYQIAPFADCVYFADRQWLIWHHAALAGHAAPYKVTRAEPNFDHGVAGLKVIAGNAGTPLSIDPRYVAGTDSGANAINLAVHFGARRIVLLGFDMKPGHWHEDHPHPTAASIYTTHFLPHYARMAPALRAQGIEVINTSMDSALTCFIKRPLAELL